VSSNLTASADLPQGAGVTGVGHSEAQIFEEAPWLALPPGEAGQADLLASLETASTADFTAALDRLQRSACNAAAASVAPADPPGSEPRDFLRSVMNDAAAPMALRIEAAESLLT